MESFDPNLTRPQVSTRVHRSVIEHFSEVLGEDAVAEIVARSGLSLGYMQRPEQWVSLSFGEHLNQALAEHLCGGVVPPYGDPVWDHWRQAGRRSVSQQTFGPLWALARALGSPASFFRAFPLISSQANRLTRFHLTEMGRGLAVIEAELSGPVPTTPAYCHSRRGMFERVPTLWGLPEASVEHPRCIHHPHTPAEKCVYIVRYTDRQVSAITARVVVSVLFAVLGGIIAADLAAPAPALSTALGGVCGLSLERWLAHRNDQRARNQDLAILRQTLEEAHVLNEQLWTERTSLRRLLLTNQKISGYLDPSLVQRIVDSPEDDLVPGGERAAVSVLFVDIVGFTARCEAHPPEQVVRDLNIFFATIDPVIELYHGILDKRIGDAVMAVFTEQPGAAPRQARALGCAAGILSALADCNAALLARGSEGIDIRLGVSDGAVVQGNLGSDLRYEFTVIGGVVNLAARLEGLARRNHALVEASLLPWVPDDLQIIATESARVRGRAESIDVLHLGLSAVANVAVVGV